MLGEIGRTSGDIWRDLAENGPMSVAQLSKKLQRDRFMVAAALGWLARENKIDLIKSGKTLKASLQ